jgi:membrane associated rhomboid family serine protease
MHLNFFHLICNVLAVTPLLERFESEYGTLVTLALFTGRKKHAVRRAEGHADR